MNVRTNRSFAKRTYERFVLFLRSFPFFFEFFAIFEPLLTPKRPFFGFLGSFLGPNLTQKNETFFLKNGKERRERNVLLQRTEKNVENETFFCKERKRT
jgi:hypothetical protein